MTEDEMIKKVIIEYFSHHGLNTSPCRRCKNLSFKRPGVSIKCTVLPKDEWQEHYYPDAPPCDKFKEGEFQLRGPSGGFFNEEALKK